VTVAPHLFLLVPATLAALLAQEASQSLSGLLAHPHEDSAQWHREVGHAYYKAGKIEPTLEHLQKAIRLDPANEQ
jgi:tetratricopeptide (TPR) repeat protein